MALLYKINTFLKELLPEKLYSNLRLRLLKLNQSRLHVFSEEEIREILRTEMKIQQGSVVFVHSSMNQFRLDFPFFRLLVILKEMVGEEGTLLFPAWQNISDPINYAATKVFDVKKTPTDLGLLNEFARRDKNAYRSLSPWNSVAAIGKDAETIVSTHHLDDLSCGQKSPFYQLVLRKGIIIGLGVHCRYLSFVHCPEDTFPGIFPIKTREDSPTLFKAKDYNGNITEVPVRLPHSNIKHRNISKYLKNYITPLVAREFKIRGTNFFYVDAAELYHQMSALAEKKITIYSV
ncbi:MAG: AAC(3) family N-acetyltransferase [Bacteroidales bacterium]